MKRGVKTHWSTSDRRVSWSSCLLMYKADDSVHSLLIICSFCEDVWEADRASVTALSGARGQMDAITCFHASGSERNLASNFKVQSLKWLKGSDEFKFSFFSDSERFYETELKLSMGAFSQKHIRIQLDVKMQLLLFAKKSKSLKVNQRCIALMCHYSYSLSCPQTTSS